MPYAIAALMCLVCLGLMCYIVITLLNKKSNNKDMEDKGKD